MENLVIDLHIHSHHSKDSLSKPKDIIKRAKKKGLTCIAITDHNTILGGLEGNRIAKNDESIKVIIGSEIKTNHGDLIGLFLNENIKSKNFEEVIDEIKSQDGLSILPHPFREHTNVREIAPLVDAIEVWNSRSWFKDNVRAKLLAEEFNKKTSYGSDAHSISEIGNVQVQIMSTPDIITGSIMKPICLNRTTNWSVGKSLIVKRLRKKQYTKLASDGFKFIFKRHF